jgi:hypothetical protein
MTGVDVTFERLQPVARALDCAGVQFGAGQHVRLQVWQWRWLAARAHVGPDDPAALLTWIGDSLNFVFEV